MKPFFSFAVPCCDVEPYIEECLQSILNQSFQDWECILGIETSKDRTEEIISMPLHDMTAISCFNLPCRGLFFKFFPDLFVFFCKFVLKIPLQAVILCPVNIKE